MNSRAGLHFKLTAFVNFIARQFGLQIIFALRRQKRVIAGGIGDLRIFLLIIAGRPQFKRAGLPIVPKQRHRRARDPCFFAAGFFKNIALGINEQIRFYFPDALLWIINSQFWQSNDIRREFAARQLKRQKRHCPYLDSQTRTKC